MPLSPTEVRIGNLVRCIISGVDQGIVPATADILKLMGSKYPFCICEGVELTEKIIDRCPQFQKVEEAYFLTYTFKYKPVLVEQTFKIEYLDTNMFGWCDGNTNVHIYDIHSLQNLFFAVTKIELEITLPAQNEE